MAVCLKPFLATLVALHFTPVSESLSRWAEFRTSVAWSLRACFQRIRIKNVCNIVHLGANVVNSRYSG